MATVTVDKLYELIDQMRRENNVSMSQLNRDLTDKIKSVEEEVRGLSGGRLTVLEQKVATQEGRQLMSQFLVPSGISLISIIISLVIALNK